MASFSSEQLNFFKFSSVVLDEFPVALRQVFVFMWDTLVATTPGVPKWDDSVTVLNIFQTKEGGVKKVPTLNKSYKEWDSTGLFRATLLAQTFAMPDGSGGLSTLDKLYAKPRGLSPGTFHPSVVSPTGNTAETYALALDQLRLLRNTLCHQISTQKIDKLTFDHYILLAKDTFTALGQDTTRIDDIGKLDEEDFPTAKLQQVEDELKREKDTAVKFKQLEDYLDKIESQVKYVESGVKDVKTEVTDVKTQVGDFVSDIKELKTDVVDIKQAMQAESLRDPFILAHLRLELVVFVLFALAGALAKYTYDLEPVRVVMNDGDSCSVSRDDREDCGYPGISSQECKSRGCCFDSRIVGTIWCFSPKQQGTKSCSVVPKYRKDCGYPGISSQECESRGCCFNSSIGGTIWCFPKASCAVNPKDRKDCGYPRISSQECESRGCCFDSSIINTKWCFYQEMLGHQ